MEKELWAIYILHTHMFLLERYIIQFSNGQMSIAPQEIEISGQYSQANFRARGRGRCPLISDF